MKKLMAFAAALALAAPIGFVSPAAAAGNGNSGVTAFCQAFAATYGISQGNCLAYINAGATVPNANTFCHAFQFSDPALFNSLFPTFGACTSAFNAYLHS